MDPAHSGRVFPQPRLGHAHPTSVITQNRPLMIT
jgi:hypothetical protein